MVSPTAFVDHLLSLVASEQSAEQTSTSLLLSSCPFSLLVQRGLALSSLAPSQTSIGLAGRALLDLELAPAVAGSARARASAGGAAFPPHGFRTGDLAVMIPAGGVKGQGGKGKGSAGGAKGGGKEGGGVDWQKGVKGVVYRVTEGKITLALGGGSAVGGGGEDEDKEEVELGTNIRLVKLANPTTFDRQTGALKQLRRLIEASLPLTPNETHKPQQPTQPTSDVPDAQHTQGTNQLDTQIIDPDTIQPPAESESGAAASAAADPAEASSPDPSPTPPDQASSLPPPRPRQPAPLSPLLQVLLGIAPPSPIPQDAPAIEWIDPRLNASQQAAVHLALGAPEVGLVWGPPGTGKTQTLVEVIRQLVARGERVLVCGGSNLSVDNLLERLALPDPSGGAPIPLTRIGHPARVLAGLVGHTLDSQSVRTDAQGLLGDIKGELLGLTNELGVTGKERVRGKARRDKWGEVRELRKEFRKREGGVVREVLSKAKVVLATTHGAGSRVLERMSFDTLIIDEAAQCVEPSCWIPILKAKRLVLAGDHLQLPPTVKSAKPGEGLDKHVLGTTNSKPVKPPSSAVSRPAKPERDNLDDAEQSSEDDDELEEGDDSQRPPQSTPSSSTAALAARPPRLRLTKSLTTTLFSRLLALHGDTLRRMLTVSYRFNAKICSFPSRRLYGGELVAAEAVKDRKLTDLDGVEDDELEEQVVFVDTAGAGMYERASEGGKGAYGSESKANENEAQLCVEYVGELIEAGVPVGAIALVSPYNAQVTLLASLLSDKYPEGAPEVGSIDSFQGREAEVVIISLVRSNPEGAVGFLAEPRRLNVAMTRARRQLVVVGDSETVGKGSGFLKDWMDWLEEEAVVRVAQ